MKRWMKRVLIALCVMTLGITAAAFAGCSSCNDDGNSSSTESSVSAPGTGGESSTSGTGGESSTSGTGGDTCAHVWAETVVEPTCYAGGYTTKVCSECGDTVTENETAKVACSYTKTSVAATCTEDGYDQFTCKWCQDTYKNVTARATGHDTEGATWTAGEDVCVDGCTYMHVETAKCNDCQETVTFTEEFEKHTYKMTDVTYATCAEAGKKTYTCTVCNNEEVSYVEDIEIDANAHVWNDGVVDGNVTTYTCSHDATHTKKVYSAKNETVATVPADVLAETGAVELQNAEMKLDADALASVGGKDVTLAAEPADKATAMEGMSEADKAKLGDNEIFDFSMKDADGAAIAFNGKITVTVPYELGDEDPANIAVWYIGEGGKTETIAATYSYVNGQGYATFETSHFSYYTVVRLTLEERCEMYGHKFVTRTIPAACGVQGYTVTECTRCHKYERSAFTPALKHDYKGVVTAATCSAMGYTTYTCSLCGDKYVSDYTAKLTHSYVATVVAPTCTANGYTVHKCSNCGESYTDTVVNAKGHNYDGGVCTECGRKDPTVSENFYFNLLESLATAETFYFEVKDMKMSAEMTYNNGDTEIIVYEMNLARAQIGFDETGIVGKGEGTLVGSMTETGSTNYSETYFATAQFLFANGNMYVYVEGTGLAGEGAGRSTMVMSAPQSMIMGDVDEEEMSEMVTMMKQMAEMYGTGLLDIVAGMTEVNDHPLNSAMRAVVEYIYTKTETANGYTFELNEKRLKDMYTIMMEKTISEIFNLIFGATAYQDVQAWLVASVDKTIPQFEAEVKAELVNWGISLDEVYDYIDSIMFAGMEVPEGEKAPSVRDYIQSEELKEVTLLDIINMAMGEMLEEPLTADAVKEMINAYGEQLGAIKMSDIMGMMGGVNSEANKESTTTKPMPTAEEEEDPEVDVEAIIDGIVAFLEKIPVTFTTDKVGTLIDFSVSMNKLDPKELAGLFGEDMDDEEVPTMSATMRFVLNGSYAAEYDHIVKEAEKLAGANDIKEDIFTDELIVCVEEEGTYVWTGSYYRQVDTFGKETYNGVECTKVEVYTNYIYVLDEDSKDVITAMSDCHGWWEVSIQAREIYEAYAYAWVNAENKIIGVELNLDKLGKQYDYTTSVEIYYNPTTGEHAPYSQHNYKFVKMVEGEGICAEAYSLYRCSVCGMEDRGEYSSESGHDWTWRYVLAEGSKTCKDGAIEQRYCTKCGRIEHEYETKSHQFNYEYKLVYTSPVCGEVYARVGTCPCGEQSYVSDHYEWMTDCQIDHVDGDPIDIEGTKYTYHYIDTYACSIEGCGFTYTRENIEWNEYDATATDNKTCKHYDVYTYDFGNGVKLTRTNWWYSHSTTGSSIGNSYGGSTYTFTCTLCNQITEIRAEDQYGRIVRVEYPIDGPNSGYYREWTGCDFVEYGLDGEYRYEDTDHQDVWTSTSYECTQYSVEGRYCTVCDWYEGYYQAPDYWWHNDHEYYYDWASDTYVCSRCGTKNEKGADGWIVLEDMVEGNNLQVGYFNKYDGWWNDQSYAFDTVEITVVANYDPTNEEGNYGVELGGEELFTREITSPVGRRESGIITLDHEALGLAVQNPDLGVSVETVSVVFWIELTSKTTGEAYVVGYGLTFTLGELGL